MYFLNDLLPFDWLSSTGLAGWAEGSFATFLLVACRLFGFVLMAPAWTGSAIAWHLRLFLVLSLSLVLTPLVSSVAPAQSPAPQTIIPAGGEIVADGTTPDLSLFSTGWFQAAVAELLLGVVLGFGVLAVVSALQMAGELIDPHCGFQGSRLFQVDSPGQGNITGRLLMLTGLLVFLVLPGRESSADGGLMLLVHSFLQTFESLPTGTVSIGTGVVDLLIALVHHSLALCLLVAAPVLACSTLLSLFLGVLGRSIPETANYQSGVPLRTVCCLLVLAFTLSGAATAITAEIPTVLHQIQTTLTGGV